jgi:hypothetical protein
MAVIRFFVMGFAVHQSWASGYQRASTQHDVRIEVIPAERWKYRMMAACAEWEDKISPEDDIVVVDGMFDVTVLVAILRSRGTNDPNAKVRIPKVHVYFHENQFTTPFTSQDRDKKNNTHWHYGIAHWRSLLVADGFIFNSQTHFDAFAAALPKMINEQCPWDVAQWQLQRAETLLKTRCAILPNGLELDELVQFQSKKRPRPTASSELTPALERCASCSKSDDVKKAARINVIFERFNFIQDLDQQLACCHQLPQHLDNPCSRPNQQSTDVHSPFPEGTVLF